MRVLKVVAEGLTTSFRRPHFMHGIQPTFRMPPPATIYGHLCSALGDVVPPEGIAFAYHFTAQTSFSDIEHTHIVFECTLLPYDMAVKVGSGITELLPRYLDYERKRTPTFARYLLLEHRVFSDKFWDFESSTPNSYWTDPT